MIPNKELLKVIKFLTLCSRRRQLTDLQRSIAYTNSLVLKGFMEYTRDDFLLDFEDIIKTMLDLTKRKNNDYGGHTDPFKNFRDFGELGILVRMSDKFARIKSSLLEKRDLAVKEEVIEDTILDLAVYSVILLIYRRAHKNVIDK